MTGAPGAADQPLGLGDGVRTEFALVKSYGQQVRRITRPQAGSGAGGGRWGGAGERLDARREGHCRVREAPEEGAEVAAGFRFDVPVRFAEDRLGLSRATFLAGEMPSVPMIEIREL